MELSDSSDSSDDDNNQDKNNGIHDGYWTLQQIPMNVTSNKNKGKTRKNELFCDAYSACSNCFHKNLKKYNITPEPYSSDNVFPSDCSDNRCIGNLAKKIVIRKLFIMIQIKFQSQTLLPKHWKNNWGWKNEIMAFIHHKSMRFQPKGHIFWWYMSQISRWTTVLDNL